MKPINIDRPEDIALLQNAEGLTVGGRLTLPSGLQVPNPPKGHRWVVHTSPLLQIYCERISDELEQV